MIVLLTVTNVSAEDINLTDDVVDIEINDKTTQYWVH